MTVCSVFMKMMKNIAIADCVIRSVESALTQMEQINISKFKFATGREMARSVRRYLYAETSIY